MEEKARLIAAKLAKTSEKSRLYYRINGTRRLTGSVRNEIELTPELEKVYSLNFVQLI